MRVRRSTILVPGNVDRMIAKARDFAADTVLLDLEDAVPATDADKAQARRLVVAALKNGAFRAREVAVRVNGPRTRWFEADVAMLAAAGASSLVLPHTYGADDVARAEAAIARANVTPPEITLAVETPATLLALEEIARQAKLITALAVAPVDFTLALGSTALLGGAGGVASGEQLQWLRHKLLIVARAQGWNAIDAPVVPDPRDAEAVRHAMEASRALGFDGTGVLYPDHIAIANAAYAPSAAELAWADGVIARFETLRDGRAADTGGGKLVMTQHYEFAKSLRALAARIGDS
ncbi:MAG TPA: aldolase/citrate lyase family protein [Stellaceae bacterium]|nr:aldolase/citrate lyase family protein [Stellaceae bacterium]